MQIALNLKKLYEDDEHLWLIENAKVLREGHVDLADIEHIAETGFSLSTLPEEPPFTFEESLDGVLGS